MPIKHYDNHTDLTINDKKMVDDLIRNGCMPNKSLILLPPTIPLELERHFIRGYFDGDGWVSPRKNPGIAKIGFMGTFEVLNWIQKSISRETYLYENKIIKRGNIYIAAYGSREATIKIHQFFYHNSSIYLDRKLQIFKNIESFYGVS
jgi:hypothetical protein